MADNLAYENGYQEAPWSEMLDGKIVLMAPRPTVNHNIIADNIYCAFRNHLSGKTCTPFSDGIDVYLTEKDQVIPDGMIVCNRNIVKMNGIHGAPDLIVEVISRSTERRDKGYKKALYEACGVKEYWIVDPRLQSVEVYLLKESRYVLDDIYGYCSDLSALTPEERETYKSAVPVSLYNDFSVPLKDIFANLF